MEKMGEAETRNPEPARGAVSAPSGAPDEAGHAWVVEICDHGGKVAKRFITTRPMRFFLKGDGWTAVNRTTWFKTVGDRLLVVRVDGQVWKEVFGNGTHYTALLGRIERLEVVE